VLQTGANQPAGVVSLARLVSPNVPSFFFLKLFFNPRRRADEAYTYILSAP
jgi:hypothetical protein